MSNVNLSVSVKGIYKVKLLKAILIFINWLPAKITSSDIELEIKVDVVKVQK